MNEPTRKAEYKAWCPDCHTAVTVPTADRVATRTAKPTPAEIGEYRIGGLDPEAKPDPDADQRVVGKSVFLSVEAAPSKPGKGRIRPAAQDARAGSPSKPVLPTKAFVECATCQELMEAPLRDKPYRIKCRECGTAIRVPGQAEHAARHVPESTPATEVGEYELGDPVARKPRRRAAFLEEVTTVEPTRKAPPPKWLFFSNVWLYPWSETAREPYFSMLWQWAALSFAPALILVLSLLSPVFRLLAGAFLLGVIFILMAMAYAATICVTCIIATAANDDTPLETPDVDMGEWVHRLLQVGMMGLTSVMIAAVSTAWISNEDHRAISILGVSFAAFPYMLLSSLHANSIFLPLSWDVTASLFRIPHVWLMYWILLGLLLGWYVGLTVLCGSLGPGVALIWTLFQIPVSPAVWLIASRLTGRLAYRIGQTVIGRQ
jgi:hypothetical protein